MSWKGLKKAVSRLPHLVQESVGGKQVTHDADFDAIQEEFLELEKLSQKLAQSAQKYKEAFLAMLKHQESFAKTLLELYEPIPGKHVVGGGSSSSVSSPQEEQVGAVVSSSNYSSLNRGKWLKKSRSMTDETAMERVQAFVAITTNIKESLSPELEWTIDRQVVQPAKEWILIHQKTKKLLTKRDHKRIDYDRHTDALNKAKEKMQTSEREDERKVVRLQNSVDVATRDYDAINDMLKQELPLYIHLRLRIVIPILHALVQHNLNLFQSYHSQFMPMNQYVGNLNEPVIDSTYLERRKIAEDMIDQISILKLSIRRDSTVSSNGGSVTNSRNSIVGDAAVQEFDDETPPPYQSVTDNPSSATRRSLSGKPPVVIPKNPFFTQASLESPPKPPHASTSHAGSNQNPVPSPFVQASSVGASGGMAAAALKKAPVPVPTKPTHLRQPSPTARPTATALYDFAAQEAGDLSFTQGQKILVLEKTAGENGWWRGRVLDVRGQPTGNEGIFPGNYVKMD